MITEEFMKRIFTLLICLLFLTTIQSKSFAAQAPSINAPSAVLIDLNSGKILYKKNADTKYGPASTTKVMTALLTLEKCKLDEVVTIGQKPPYEDGSKIYVIEGEELTVEQLLYAMMLESANDAALALAEYIGGSKEGFAEMMNQKAKDLGCKNTNFVNPNGLSDDNHYTTAKELAIITFEAMKNEKFREIVSTISYKIQPTNKQPELRYINNHNKLLFNKTYKYPGADGIKTGYTIKTRHTFVGSATKGDMRLAVVILNSERTFYNDTKTLLDYGFSKFSSQKVLSKDEPVSNITITGTDVSIPVYPKEDYYVTQPIGEDQNVDKNIVLDNSFSDIIKGQVVGFAEISSGSDDTSKISLVSGDDYKNSVYDIKSENSGSYKKVISPIHITIPITILFVIFLARGFIRKYKKSRR
jgi:serine-type D-Ala-D-Ala carboxypeptidase (penicillin-binding protein 5/6)